MTFIVAVTQMPLLMIVLRFASCSSYFTSLLQCGAVDYDIKLTETLNGRNFSPRWN
jgi:hypothetical protein